MISEEKNLDQSVEEITVVSENPEVNGSEIAVDEMNRKETETTDVTETDVKDEPKEMQAPPEETLPVEAPAENPVQENVQSTEQTETMESAESSVQEADLSAVQESVDEVVTEASEAVNDNLETSTPPELTEEQTQNLPDESAAAAEDEHPDEAQAKGSRQKNNWKEHLENVYNVLKAKKENNETIEVEVKSRIRGGLRVVYDDMPLFLPASHFALKRTPTEQELHDATGKMISVNIHELQEFDEGRKAVIVSRKQLLLDEFWNSISLGDIVEGRVSSVATFGVFVDLGGVEGLIHISRLSQVHVKDPSTMFKKGDKVRAVVVEIERNKNRIALSRKELEDSPWKNVEEEFPAGSQYKGIVRRLTDFGAYVELKPGIDGLLRTAEISWTKRIKRPSDVFQPGQEIDVHILSVSSEKQNVSLSYKKTLPNPWEHMAAQYPVDAEFEGSVIQVLPQGAIVSISEDVDGFMPRSKMKKILRGNKIPFQPGDKVKVVIADLIPEEESLILAPSAAEEEQHQAPPPPIENNNKPRKSQGATKGENQKAASNQGSVTLLDMLSDTDKNSLFNLSE